MKHLLTILILLFALPALAADTWFTGPGATGRVITALSPDGLRVAYFDFADATAESPTLAIGACSSVDVIFNSDTTTATASVVEGYIRGCVENTASTSVCNQIYGDAGAVTFNGDPAVGRVAIYGIGGSWIYWDTTANAGSDAARVLVVCHE